MGSEAANSLAAIRRRESAILAFLLLSSAAGLAVRLYATRHIPIGYDGYWHVFSARNFLREYRRIPHPPLFLLLVAACDRVAHDPLAYRAVGLAAGTAVVFLIGKALATVGVAPAVVGIASLLVAFSGSWIILSCEVRSYTLCAAFLLGAFLFVPDLARMDRPPGRRSRVAFSVLMVLAILSHYAAALALVALAAAPLLLAFLSRCYRRALARALPERWKADVTMLAAVVLAVGILFATVARPWAVGFTHLGYLPENYYRPGTETVGSFLGRTLASTFALLSTFSPPRAVAVGLLALSVAAAWMGALAGRSEEPEWAGRTMPAAVFTLLLLGGVIAGVTGIYPFGGLMRHQFLLLLFAPLAGGVAADAGLRALPRTARGPLVALALAAMGWRASGFVRRLSVPSPDGFPSQVMQQLSGARVVHLDQFTLIGFFTSYQAWDWRFAGRSRSDPLVETYDLSRRGRRMTVVAHRDWWTMDFAQTRLYEALASSAAANGSACFTVFSVPQWLPNAPRVDSAAIEAEIRTGAPASHLSPARVVVRDGVVFAELCRERSPVTSGRPRPDRVLLANSP